jgi:hypothetical protein
MQQRRMFTDVPHRLFPPCVSQNECFEHIASAISDSFLDEAARAPALSWRRAALQGGLPTLGVIGGWNAGGWKVVGKGLEVGRKAVGSSWNVGLEGGWNDPCPHHSAAMGSWGATVVSFDRCFESGPNCSTVIRLTFKRRSIALASARFVNPFASG